MKILQKLLLLLGIFLISLNVFTVAFVRRLQPGEKDVAFEIGYYFGMFFLLLAGTSLLFVSFRLKRKMLKKEKERLMESFLNEY